MTRMRHPVPLWCFVLLEEGERFGLVAVLEIFKGELGNEIGHVALALDFRAVGL